MRAVRFTGTLRPSQRDVVDIARSKLAAGKKRLHVVAPPGSGKTVPGLYLWAECVRRPAVVLSPNSAIQAQWAASTQLFETPEDIDVVSTSGKRPALLTSLTYQSVTLPGQPDDDLNQRAIDLRVSRLLDNEQARNPDEAMVWINDLHRKAARIALRLSTITTKLRTWTYWCHCWTATSGTTCADRHRIPIIDWPNASRMNCGCSERRLPKPEHAPVLGALFEVVLIKCAWPVHIGERAGGYVRVFLENAEPGDNGLFATAFQEAIGPPDRARYVIPRLVDRVTQTILSRLLPGTIGRFF